MKENMLRVASGKPGIPSGSMGLEDSGKLSGSSGSVPALISTKSEKLSRSISTLCCCI